MSQSNDDRVHRRLALNTIGPSSLETVAQVLTERSTEHPRHAGHILSVFLPDRCITETNTINWNLLSERVIAEHEHRKNKLRIRIRR